MVAASAYALWDIRREAEATMEHSNPERQDPKSKSCPSCLLSSPPSVSPHQDTCDRAVVAYSGSVVERYPFYREICQGYLTSLVEAEDSETSSGGFFPGGRGAIELVEAKQSSLLGAAVALASA